jgi:hypothetical protein
VYKLVIVVLEFILALRATLAALIVPFQDPSILLMKKTVLVDILFRPWGLVSNVKDTT